VGDVTIGAGFHAFLTEVTWHWGQGRI